jgi:hypothetical protein
MNTASAGEKISESATAETFKQNEYKLVRMRVLNL